MSFFRGRFDQGLLVYPRVCVCSLCPKLRGFKHGRERWVLRAIKVRITTCFGGEVKPSAPCKILWHVKDTLRYERDADRQNSAPISRPVSPRFAIRCVCCNQNEELWWMKRERLDLSWGAQ
jgi:hypothetical protein